VLNARYPIIRADRGDLASDPQHGSKCSDIGALRLSPPLRGQITAHAAWRAHQSWLCGPRLHAFWRDC